MGKCNGKQLNGKTTTVKDFFKKSVSTEVHVKTRQYFLETDTQNFSKAVP